jgi:hypothetical protein
VEYVTKLMILGFHALAVRAVVVAVDAPPGRIEILVAL